MAIHSDLSFVFITCKVKEVSTLTELGQPRYHIDVLISIILYFLLTHVLCCCMIFFVGLNGGVAQLARAYGSYP